MNVSDLPSLTALRAFAAVVEKGSISQAAQSLNVTQPAVTQQVRALETHLGRKLLKRHGRTVLLTDEGQILAQHLRRGFDAFRDGIKAVARQKGQQTIRVTTSPSFAAFWLVPRVAAFHTMHPGMTIQLDLGAETGRVSERDFDLAIRFCYANEVPEGVSPFLNVSLNVIAHWSMVPPRPWSAENLTNLPWLQEVSVSVTREWFARQGIQEYIPQQISEMPGNLIIDAIKRGEAVAYAVCDWVADDIKRGDLVEIWTTSEKGAYYVVKQNPSEACDAFINWLVNEARQSRKSNTLSETPK